MRASHGHKATVLGATLSVLTAFECIFSFEERLDGLGAQLLSCVRDAHCALRSWRLPDVNDGCMRSSLATEMRALERARAGVLRAQQMGAQLPPRDALRLQLDCFRRAAWPAAVELHGSSVHARVLERIGSGELVDLEQAISGVRGKAVPGVGSLDQFRSPESATGSTPLRSSSSASTPSLESSWSSSVGSQEGVYAEGPDLQLLARAMNGPLISEANVVVCTGARSTLRSICTRGGTG